jgi:hypothetical protein
MHVPPSATSMIAHEHTPASSLRQALARRPARPAGLVGSLGIALPLALIRQRVAHGPLHERGGRLSRCAPSVLNQKFVPLLGSVDESQSAQQVELIQEGRDRYQRGEAGRRPEVVGGVAQARRHPSPGLATVAAVGEPEIAKDPSERLGLSNLL